MRLLPRLSILVLLTLVGLAGCDEQSTTDGGVDGGMGADAQVPDDGSAPDASRPPCTDSAAVCAEVAAAATAAEMETLRDDTAALFRFLEAMPKGGDLHNHLSGAVYAEDYLDWAQEGSFCIATGGSNPLALSSSCSADGREDVPDDEDELYGDVVRAWSMLDFVPTPSRSGRDHFFSTFGKFGIISGREHPRMMAAVRRSAAAENVVYLEPMLTTNSRARNLGEDVWDAGHTGSIGEDDFAEFHAEILAASDFGSARARYVDDARETRDESDMELRCGTDAAEAGCNVAFRFQEYISRSGGMPGVFAQMVVAYEAAREEPLIVGLNLVGPEDSSGARRQYDLQMAMLGYLRTYYVESGLSPLRLSLHAGELTPEFVPSTYALNEENHIREAVLTAGADRIGHGIDITYESDPAGLFTLLRERDVLVEICLASNDIILEVSGDAHPLDAYLEAGVPIAFATDDPGVARSSLTAELFRAVADQGMTYEELTTAARASLHYSFMQGDSLFTDLANATPVADCTPADGETWLSAPLSAECNTFLATHGRARMQYEFERRRLMFEAAR
ncbi:MAG: adenosine deaminase [Sandaracinaceae bacterium]